MKILTLIFSTALFLSFSSISSETAAEALVVLEKKCNVCHLKRNRSKLFSEYNMERFAPLIHEQVFIKKRMPKGNKNNLSQEELQTLKKWLEETMSLSSN